ncbi:MAG TPA: TonB-dependent receptor [Acidobacteriaceae bacterium]|nr:TonB-dependent receptor [Acidobacteriaceae bacterium]
MVFSGALSAQVAGALHGRVLDSSGAAIPGASVNLTQTATGIQTHTVSTSAGDYDFSHLVSGKYSVNIAASGFASLVRSDVTVEVGATTALDLTLRAGASTETVTVNADAPLLQAGNSDVQTNISGHEVVALPLTARNFIPLTQLAPGVALPPGTFFPRINGGRPRTNEYLFDGISALQPEPGQVVFFPIVDDIAEFTVESNNVPAEFGRFNGGVVNVATRSGGDDVHGSVYEFLRNEDLNARNYFTRTGRKPEYRRSLYGGTLGAPLLRNKLFFFGDYQGIKQRLGATRISTVPTENERAGIFTGVAKIYNPCTTPSSGSVNRAEFANDVINPAVCPFDPRALALLAYLPHQDPGTGAANNYTHVSNDDDHQNQFDIRVDGAFSRRDRGFARYSYFSEVEQPATPFPNGGGLISGSVIGTGNVTGLTNVLGQQVVLNETHTFSSALLNDIRFGYTRRGNSQLGEQLPGPAGAALGIPNIPVGSGYGDTFPQFTFTGFQQLGSASSATGRYQTAVVELVDAVTLNRGAHSIKAGVDLRRYELNAFAPPNPTGSFQFTTTGTDTTGASGAATGGNSFASFLLGQVDTFNIDLQQRTIRPRDSIHEFFAQDDWRVSSRLTLNLGARWTLHMPSTETHNQGAVFNLATQKLDYLGENGNSRSARELHYGNVAPRVGLVFQASASTIFRSGYGIVFIDQSGITTPFTTPQYPFIQNVQQKTTDGYVQAFQLSGGPTAIAAIPATPDAGLGQSVYTANRAAGSGYVQQWNVALQHSFTANLSLDVAYAGSHIVHLGVPDQNLNQLTDAQIASGLASPAAAKALTGNVANPYFGVISANSQLGASKTIAAAQLLKPYPEFQNVAIYRNNTGSSVYNALEAKLEQRLSHGLTFIAAYTWSKLIDPASSVFSSTVLSSPNSSSLIDADTYQPGLERDLSNGDMTNVLTASAVYELTKFRGHGLLTPVLGGWTVNAIGTMQSGMPVTITDATNNNAFAGVPLQRPNVTGNPELAPSQRTPARWFNTAAFSAAPQFTFGNARRNPVRGAPYRDLDLALTKHTALSEKTDLEFRAEVFDVTNTPAFAQPNGSVGSAAFGSITATTTDPRVVQFALRLSR